MDELNLKIEYLPVESLKPYKRNARIHEAEDVAEIKKSIEKYGFDDPIGIWGPENIIVEGHGRLIAAKKCGMKEVPCIRLDHLTKKQRREYAIVHNRTAELSHWDEEIRKLESIDLDFSEFNLNFEDEKKETELSEIIEDEPPEVDEDAVPVACKGDVWQLGDNRLMCGDSTSVSDLSRLMADNMADCVVTDPPYNMAYEGAGNATDRKSKRILNDNMSDEKFAEFMRSVYRTMKSGMKDGASFYVFYKELGKGVFLTSLQDAGLTYKQELVWVKNQLVLGGSKYQSMYEPCLFGCKGKRVADWNAGRKERSVIESVDLMTEDELREAVRQLTEEEPVDIIRENKPLKNDLHPTMKPVRLLAKFIKNSTKEGETVLDLFGGSGSTMMACEQLGRSCYMMELDPKYVDVIIKRWEALTGKKAKLISCSADMMAMLVLFLYFESEKKGDSDEILQ